jgi:RND family efflux transporter MFP subunit
MKNFMTVAILAALLAGCSQPAKMENQAKGDIKVKTTRVHAAVAENKLGYSGTIEAAQVIPLSFRTVGTVEKIFVDVGDAVHKGQVLATLDNTELRNIYDATQASYRQAEDAYNRLKQVYDQGSLPEIKWVEMQTNLEQARSSFELAKNNLEKCNLVAPVSGTVGRRNIEPGMSSVSLTAAPIELVRMETVLVRISVPEN